MQFDPFYNATMTLLLCQPREMFKAVQGVSIEMMMLVSSVLMAVLMERLMN